MNWGLSGFPSSLPSTESSTTTSDTTTSSDTTTTETKTTTIPAVMSTTTSSTTSTTSTTSGTTTTITTTTTRTTTTTTTTAYNCSAAAPASWPTISGTGNFNWTQYKYNYTANTTNPTLVFTIKAATGVYVVLDEVSVFDNNDTSTQLLQNPSFDNSSTTPPTGWTMWCQNSCSSGLGNLTTNATNCITGNCYRSQCIATIGDCIGQSFSTVVGRAYTISFWYRRIRTSAFNTAYLYVGIM